MAQTGAEFDAVIKSAQRGAKNLDKVSGSLKTLEETLSNIGKLNQKVASIHQIVSKRLTNYFRAALVQSYKASGIGTISTKYGYKPTGELLSAVSNVEVIASDRGIRLGLQAGKSAEFYARAGALNYGSVRGSSTKGKKRAKLKKALAQSGTTSSGGVSTTRAFNFFKLTAAQSQELNAKYIEFFQQEVNKFLGVKGG